MNNEIRTKLVDATFDAWAEMKQHEWDKHGKRDSEAGVAVLTGEGDLEAIPGSIVELTTTMMGGHFAQAIPMLLEMATGHPKCKRPWRGVIVVCDSYIRQYASQEEAASHMPLHGSLEKEFQRNPGTDVTEALTVSLFYNDVVNQFRETSGTLPYKVNDYGELEWGKRTIMDNEDWDPQGNVSDGVRPFMTGGDDE